jgi:hypothetical protein
LTVVAPVNVLAAVPISCCVPLPIFVSATVPEPSSITPLKMPPWLLPPTVSVNATAVPDVTVPLPSSPPMVGP